MRLLGSWEQEGQRLRATREGVQADAINGLLKLAVEVVDPELIEVAEDHELGSVRHHVDPVLERLAVVALEVSPGLLHLDQDPWLPLQVGVRRAAVVVLFDALLQSRARLAHALVAERPEEVLQEERRLALLVPGQMLVAIANEALKALA